VQSERLCFFLESLAMLVLRFAPGGDFVGEEGSDEIETEADQSP